MMFCTEKCQSTYNEILSSLLLISSQLSWEISQISVKKPRLIGSMRSRRFVLGDNFLPYPPNTAVKFFRVNLLKRLIE
jgi:hypothetical protein